MSAFNTEKFYRYRGLTRGGSGGPPGKGGAVTGDTIAEDKACPGCGYNLRGLPYGGKCPECARPILVSRPGAFDITEVPRSLINRLRWGVRIALVAWVGMMLFLLLAYIDLLYAGAPVILALGVGATLAAAWLCTPAIPGFDDPNEAAWRSPRALTRMLAPFAGAAAVATLVVKVVPSVPINAVIIVVSLATIVWIAFQAVACLALQRLCVAVTDEPLGRGFWHQAWCFGLLGPVAAAFMALVLWLNSRMGGAPTCCFGGYWPVFGFALAEVWFGFNVFRLQRTLGWAVSYYDQRDARDDRLKRRFRVARGGNESSFDALR